MARYLHQLSGLSFYLLGGSFFLMALLLRNGMAGAYPLWWMQVADLPLLLSAMLYGGTSLHLSLTPPGSSPRLNPVLIGVPLALLFGLFAVMNFWGRI